MTHLSVNINKVATLRNARGGAIPNVLLAAERAQQYGAEGITVHPRPDERHITYDDVLKLRPVVTTEFNIEGNPNPRFNELVFSVKPEQVTLVPDPPEALTSNAGWDTVIHQDYLREIVQEFRDRDIRVSIFVSPDRGMVEGAAKAGADRVELYTEPYAREFLKDREAAVLPYVEAARCAKELGMKVNAGHDLDLNNLAFLIERIPFLAEVSIGHALIADALYMGLERSIVTYLHSITAGQAAAQL